MTALLGGKGPMVRRYESGEVKPPEWAVVDTMLKAYEASASDHAETKRLWNEVDKGPRSARLPTGTKGAYRKLVNAEREAVREREMGSQALPGLLQTRNYMHALMTAGHRLRGEKERPESLVKARETRQTRLTADRDPLRLEALVDEAVLRREVGGPAVLREQLAHLLVVAEWPNIDLRAIPFESGAYGSMSGACLIIDFPEPNPSSAVYLEHPGGGSWLDTPEQVNPFTAMFDDVTTQALTPADTTDLIHEHMKRLSTRT
jgi:hypothetical protein